jgi:hypothetical protein
MCGRVASRDDVLAGPACSRHESGVEPVETFIGGHGRFVTPFKFTPRSRSLRRVGATARKYSLSVAARLESGRFRRLENEPNWENRYACASNSVTDSRSIEDICLEHSAWLAGTGLIVEPRVPAGIWTLARSKPLAALPAPGMRLPASHLARVLAQT